MNDASFRFFMKTVTIPPPTTPLAGKRERILRAAVEVFARTGYFTARVSEIAREAGVADGTIYLYFQGKEDLLVTIFREHTRRYLELLREEIGDETDPELALRLAIRFHLQMLGSDRALAVVFQVELRQSLKFMALFSHEELADYLALLRTLVEQGQERGKFRPSLRPQLVAKCIFGVLDEMVTSWILSDKHDELREQADPVADFIIRGLL
jgi:TetR/AcrR family fatty acid metabolism transcriptional regulator